MGNTVRMTVSHYTISGMGEVRSVGDLIVRIEYNSNMKIDKAKEYVVNKLRIFAMDIADEYVIGNSGRSSRSALSLPSLRGIAAKMNIKKPLDIEINSCEKFR